MNGIDISHHNGSINWIKVINSSFKPEFVYIKCTQGIDYKDPLFLKNAKDAKASGIKIGYYHFASLNNDDIIADASKEAKWFLSNVKIAT